MKFRTLLLPFACALLLPACGGDPDPAATTGGGGQSGSGGSTSSTSSSTGTGGSEPLAITWSDCNLITEGPETPAKCGEVDVPLRWSDPAGKTISLFVKKLPATKARRGSVWLLDGGPGGGGIGPEGLAYYLGQKDPGLDLYIPHHRGTGQSTKLRCPGDRDDSENGLEITANEWPACIDALKAEWGDGLAGFSTSEAARDLGALIEAEKQPGDQVFVLGSSYGTYLANRYLRLFPDQPSALILDSVCPPDGCHLDQFDVNYDEVGDDFLALCAADATCASFVGPGPKQRLQDLYAALQNGHCPALADLGVDWRLLRQILGQALNNWNGRLVIAPLIYRLERCDPADVTAFQNFIVAFFGPPDAPPDPFLKAWSFPLANNIVFSEMWSDPPPTADALKASSDATLISEGVALGDADVFPLWPRYARDEHVGKWGETDLPLLMMNGDLDPATPIWIAETAGEHWKGPHQTFVKMARTAHGAAGNSVIAPDGSTCGLKLVVDFLADPQQQLDTSCKDQVMPIKFGGASWLAQKFFGTDDMFENPSP